MREENINDLIVEEIMETAEADGDFFVCVEVRHPDGSTSEIEVNGELEWDGYCENDYFDGTGCWVTTHVSARIKDVEIHSWDNDDEPVKISGIVIDTRYIENELRSWLYD